MKIMASSPITSCQIDGETMETVADFIFLGSKITADGDCSLEIKRRLLLGRRAMTNLDSILKSRCINHFADKGLSNRSYGFLNSHVWMWELDHKESWALKNWCFWTVVLEKTLESPLDCKEIQPVNPKGNQSWIFIGSTDAEAEALWPPNWKAFDAGKDWRQEEMGTTEDEMASPTLWTWVSASSGSWWWTGRLGMLQSMELQRVGHDWATELLNLTLVVSDTSFHSFIYSSMHVCVSAKSLQHVWFFETLWTVAHQAPLSLEFSRQEYWSGLPCPPPGDLPDTGIKPVSLMSPALAGGFFTTSTTWEAPPACIHLTNIHRLLVKIQALL